MLTIRRKRSTFDCFYKSLTLIVVAICSQAFRCGGPWACLASHGGNATSNIAATSTLFSNDDGDCATVVNMWSQEEVSTIMDSWKMNDEE